MTSIKWALLADGSSDRALEPIIRWTILDTALDIRVTESPTFIVRGSDDLECSIQSTIMDYRPDLLFVHRDAEAMDLAARLSEIPQVSGSVIRVVPVRMTESWLLIDAQAIRSAAGNPNGQVRLSLPPPRRLEGLPDPKSDLMEALVKASELSSGRKRKFKRSLPRRIQEVANAIDDYSPLRSLRSFQAFESELTAALGPLSNA